MGKVLSCSRRKRENINTSIVDEDTVSKRSNDDCVCSELENESATMCRVVDECVTVEAVPPLIFDPSKIGSLSFKSFNNKIRELIQNKPFRGARISDSGIELNNESMLNLNSINANKDVEVYTVEFDNGVKYTGEWCGGWKEGYGIQRWLDGTIYEGYWLKGQAMGLGRFAHADGDCYIGQWAFDRANGYGEYTHSDGSAYRGGWYDDKKHGYGQEHWCDGSMFTGIYYSGKKEGQGKFVWSDGSYYQGNFTNNSISGYGVYVWSDGRQYEGDWQNNRMHGQGNFKWKDGRHYVGSYVNDKKEGYGEFHWSDMRSYCGNWLNGKQHGKGMIRNRSGEVLCGVWENGLKLSSEADTKIDLIFENVNDNTNNLDSVEINDNVDNSSGHHSVDAKSYISQLSEDISKNESENSQNLIFDGKNSPKADINNIRSLSTSTSLVWNNRSDQIDNYDSSMLNK